MKTRLVAASTLPSCLAPRFASPAIAAPQGQAPGRSGAVDGGAHRSAARQLRAAGDLEGARLELGAACVVIRPVETHVDELMSVPWRNR